MEEIKLNKEQCQEIALTIFADIERYVNAHAEEYEKFLLEEKLSKGEAG